MINPLAQARWFDAMWRDEKDFHLEQFQREINEGKV